MVNAERFITPELKYEVIVSTPKARFTRLLRVFRSVCEQISTFSARLLETARALGGGQPDFYQRQRQLRALMFRLRKGRNHQRRHPVVRLNTLTRFIANDTVFDR